MNVVLYMGVLYMIVCVCVHEYACTAYMCSITINGESLMWLKTNSYQFGGMEFHKFNLNFSKY